MHPQRQCQSFARESERGLKPVTELAELLESLSFARESERGLKLTSINLSSGVQVSFARESERGLKLSRKLRRARY